MERMAYVTLLFSDKIPIFVLRYIFYLSRNMCFGR